MKARGVVVWGGVVVALALLAVGGAIGAGVGPAGLATGGSAGCNAEPQTVPDKVPDDVMTATALPRPANSVGPSQDFLEDYNLESGYLVKLTEEAIANLDAFDGDIVLSPAQFKDLEIFKITDAHHAVRTRAGADVVGVATRPQPVPVRAPAGTELPDLGRWVMVTVPEVPAAEVIAKLESFPWVEVAERMTLLEVSSNPVAHQAPPPGGDALRGYQWNLDTLQVQAVHQITDGEGVTVAVVDSGVEAHHDGFRNLESTRCLDLVDEDTTCDDPNGHGTHVTGVIAQTPDNGLGALGLAPGVKVLPVRVADARGWALASDVAAGIVYAADEGAQVIYVGLAGYEPSQILLDAVLYAERMGSVVVAPAGNHGFTEFAAVPATLPGVIGVGCSTMDGTYCPYSNRSPEIHVIAPGGDMTVDSDGDGLKDGILQEGKIDGRWGYVVREGTSLSAAHVAAAAALVVSKGGRTPFQVSELLGQNLDEAPGAERGVGIVNIESALNDLMEMEAPNLPGGSACLSHMACASGICEGQGCGQETPGVCASESRSCTLDLKAYCGCDQKTFFASGSCPNGRFDHVDACEGAQGHQRLP